MAMCCLTREIGDNVTEAESCRDVAVKGRCKKLETRSPTELGFRKTHWSPPPPPVNPQLSDKTQSTPVHYQPQPTQQVGKRNCCSFSRIKEAKGGRQSRVSDCQRFQINVPPSVDPSGYSDMYLRSGNNNIC